PDRIDRLVDCKDYMAARGHPATPFLSTTRALDWKEWGRGRGGDGMGPSLAFSMSEPDEPGGVRTWPGTLARWLFGLRSDLPDAKPSPTQVARFRNVCISREAGAGGGTIGRMVARRLGWKVYDHEILEAIAHRMELSADEVRVFDELAPSVVQDWILPLR